MGKTIILGAGGRLGAALARVWAATGEEILGLDRGSFPLDDPMKVEQALLREEFDVLVNCAALTQVDYCESHQEEAFRVNAEAPGKIAEVCSRKGARCIHIGTDYVFDGLSDHPYSEQDEGNACERLWGL